MVGWVLRLEVLELPDFSDIIGKWKFGTDPDEPNCWSLCKEAGKRLGVELPFYSAWIKSLHERLIYINNRKDDDFVPLDKPEIGCIVLFKVAAPKPNHMGIMVDNKGNFIHVFEGTRASIENVNRMRWHNRIVGYYKYAKHNKIK